MMKNETIDNIRVENDREHETVADIAAVLRRYVLPSLAERLEAARKREKAQVGNAAALREALRTLRQRFDNNVMAYQDRYFKFSGWHWHKKAAEAARWRDVFCELREACDAALAAPLRNCDVFNDAEAARQAWLDDRDNWDEFGSPKLELHEWLLAPAAERKGEGDGR